MGKGSDQQLSVSWGQLAVKRQEGNFDDVTEFFSPDAAGKSVMFLIAVGKSAKRKKLSVPNDRGLRFSRHIFPSRLAHDISAALLRQSHRNATADTQILV